MRLRPLETSTRRKPEFGKSKTREGGYLSDGVLRGLCLLLAADSGHHGDVEEAAILVAGREGGREGGNEGGRVDACIFT
jgi:hypothetical protein